MYMAVGLRANYFNTHSDLRFQLAYFVYLPRVYCMSPSGEILPVRFLTLVNGGDTRLPSLHRTVCPNVLATTTISTPVPVHARTELCILGSECSGVGHCPRSSVTETCALPRSLFTKCISGRVKFQWPERRDPISLSTNLVSHRVRGAWLEIEHAVMIVLLSDRPVYRCAGNTLQSRRPFISPSYEEAPAVLIALSPFAGSSQSFATTFGLHDGEHLCYSRHTSGRGNTKEEYYSTGLRRGQIL